MEDSDESFANLKKKIEQRLKKMEETSSDDQPFIDLGNKLEEGTR